jgi:hypothetical protein
VRRHGAPNAKNAYQQAAQIVMDWLERGWHRELRVRWDQRLRRLGGTNQVTRDSGLLVPAVHPETVTLAGLLASPWWRSHLQHDRGAASGPFLMEAGRRLGIRYPAMSWHDPLVAWTNDHLADRVEDQAAEDDPLMPLLHLPDALVLAERRDRFPQPV